MKIRPLSIIIPHYDKVAALRNIHEEIKLQIEPTDSVIIVDDFSPNGVPDLGCKCTRVIRPPEKLDPHVYRLNTLRNLGVAAAEHDAVVILDPDCRPNPSYLTNARSLFDPSILFAGRIDYIQKDGTPTADPRTTNKQSGWIDDLPGHGNGLLVWGGNMMFSKSRTALIGWFDTEFDGSWGAEEHEFASKCFNSGMRLFYSKELLVQHLYHEVHRPGPGNNVKLWQMKAREHRKHLNITSPYKPAVGVSVITMLRPDILDQCLRSIFRNIIPVRVRLCVNGDDSPGTKQALQAWQEKWAVDIVKSERISPSKIRNDAAQWAKNQGYKHLVIIDDDIIVSPNGLVNLVSAIESRPDIHACAGYLRNAKNNDMMLGGSIRDNHLSYLRKRPGIYDVSWVGSGFTVCRLDDFTPFDENYEMGWEDPDWCMEMVKRGKKLAVCGDAGAYHRVMLTKNGVVTHNDSSEYNKIRYDSARHERMSNLFQSKWGFPPVMGAVVDR